MVETADDRLGLQVFAEDVGIHILFIGVGHTTLLTRVRLFSWKGGQLKMWMGQLPVWVRMCLTRLL